MQEGRERAHYTKGVCGGNTERVERLAPGDLTVLATDAGPVPMQIAAVLTLAPPARPTRAELAAVLSERLPEVPRLRQCLVRPRWGAGRPYWAEDPDFDLAHHLGEHPAADEQGLLDVAAELVCTRLDEQRPLWRACLVTGAPGTPSGLVIVIHHVLADGLGGLAVLGALTDQAPPTAPGPIPHPGPTTRAPSAGAARDLVRRLARLPSAARAGLAGLGELGLGNRPRFAARTSLNRPTGPRRRISRTGASLAQVRTAAHRAGATVNDVVVTAVVGALLEVLHRRGEHPGALVVSVPVSARRGTDPRTLGNQVGVRPMRVPALADHHERLRAVTALRRSVAAAPPASSAGPLGLAFRILGRLGLFQWFIDRQRLVHTFVTNVRGPGQSLRLAGYEITAVTPVVVNPGNVAVAFDVLSYAGWLGITTVADPDLVPDLGLLTRSLEETLHRLID